MKMTCFCLLTIVAMVSVFRVQAARQSYVAAVYEHAPFLLDPEVLVTQEEARANMQRNIDVYEQQVIFAKKQGTDMIIFPEDGLYGFGFSRDTLEPYLEDIPDPEQHVCPCNDAAFNQTMPVQFRLSCLAKKHQIFLVVNAGDIKVCTGEAGCPSDGRFQYNTDVVYDPLGYVVARYHKQNLFFEVQFDQPAKMEYSYFDTPFGRIGLSICFDILFKDPIVDLVEVYNVTTVAFPTAWMDALPLLSAVGFHSGWARGMGVNLLVSNIHLPDRRMAGSGIYTPEGVISYTRSQEKDGVLLVSNVTVPSPKPRPNVLKTDSRVTNSDTDAFESDLFGDTFNFVYLDPSEKTNIVCQRNLCCNATYRGSGKKNEYALGALDKLHTLEGQYYLQICVILKCANSSLSSCGSPTTSATWRFSELYLSGTFQTPYVYPEVMTDKVTTPQMQTWTFRDKSIYIRNVSDKILSASLFGRWYEKDDMVIPTQSGNNSANGIRTPNTTFVLIVLYFLLQ